MSKYFATGLRLNEDITSPWFIHESGFSCVTSDIPTHGDDTIIYFTTTAPNDIDLQKALSQVITFTFDGENRYYEFTDLLEFFSNLTRYCCQLDFIRLINFNCLSSELHDATIGRQMLERVKFNQNLSFVFIQNVSSTNAFVVSLLDVLPLSNLDVFSVTKISPSQTDICAFLRKLFEVNTKLICLELNELLILTDDFMKAITSYLRTNNLIGKLSLDDTVTNYVSDSVLEEYFDTLQNHTGIHQALHRRRPHVVVDPRFSRLTTNKILQ